MNFTIEVEQEEDERFLAEVTCFPDVLAYGQTQQKMIFRLDLNVSI